MHHSRSRHCIGNLACYFYDSSSIVLVHFNLYLLVGVMKPFISQMLFHYIHCIHYGYSDAFYWFNPAPSVAVTHALWCLFPISSDNRCFSLFAFLISGRRQSAQTEGTKALFATGEERTRGGAARGGFERGVDKEGRRSQSGGEDKRDGRAQRSAFLR